MKYICFTWWIANYCLLSFGSSGILPVNTHVNILNLKLY